MKKVIETIIFRSRWILIPFYFGLILAQTLYCLKFLENVGGLVMQFGALDESRLMLIVLSLVDMAMVANLIKMIISGSYQTFVSRIDADHTEKIGSGLLKVKMGSSLVGISSIHLLSAFINASGESTRSLIIKCCIHLIFVASTIALAVIDFLHVYSKQYEDEYYEK